MSRAHTLFVDVLYVCTRPYGSRIGCVPLYGVGDTPEVTVLRAVGALLEQYPDVTSVRLYYNSGDVAFTVPGFVRCLGDVMEGRRVHEGTVDNPAAVRSWAYDVYRESAYRLNMRLLCREMLARYGVETRHVWCRKVPPVPCYELVPAFARSSSCVYAVCAGAEYAALRIEMSTPGVVVYVPVPGSLQLVLFSVGYRAFMSSTGAASVPSVVSLIACWLYKRGVFETMGDVYRAFHRGDWESAVARHSVPHIVYSLVEGGLRGDLSRFLKAVEGHGDAFPADILRALRFFVGVGESVSWAIFWVTSSWVERLWCVGRLSAYLFESINGHDVTTSYRAASTTLRDRVYTSSIENGHLGHGPVIAGIDGVYSGGQFDIQTIASGVPVVCMSRTQSGTSLVPLVQIPGGVPVSYTGRMFAYRLRLYGLMLHTSLGCVCAELADLEYGGVSREDVSVYRFMYARALRMLGT